MTRTSPIRDILLLEHRDLLDDGYWPMTLHPTLLAQRIKLLSVPDMVVHHRGPFDFRLLSASALPVQPGLRGRAAQKPVGGPAAAYLVAAPTHPAASFWPHCTHGGQEAMPRRRVRCDASVDRAGPDRLCRRRMGRLPAWPWRGAIRGRVEPAMAAPEHPVLSIVVVIVSDTTEHRAPRRPRWSIVSKRFAQQVDAPPFEIIVPHHEHVEGIEEVKARFPDVRSCRAPMSCAHPGGREHHDVLRACGLAAARGDIVGLLEDHARPDAHWAANVVAAHRQTHAAVGGAIENGVDRRAQLGRLLLRFWPLSESAAGRRIAFRLRCQHHLQACRAGKRATVWEDAFARSSSTTL